eukprot:7988902-Pyramimonas_sp.AAC.1
MEKGFWLQFPPPADVRLAFVASLNLSIPWPLPTCNGDDVESPIVPFSLVRVPLLFPSDMPYVASIAQVFAAEVRGCLLPPSCAQERPKVFQELGVLGRVLIASAVMVNKR